LATERLSCAIDLEGAGDNTLAVLGQFLSSRPTIAHNWTFDSGWIKQVTGYMPKYGMCTYAAYKLLANEGNLGQVWNLKDAMTRLLGWPNSNEKELYDWLKANKLSKGDMHLAPWDVLGEYCALDTAATWQLHRYFDKELDNWPHLRSYINGEVATISQLVVEQQLRGMSIDIEYLEGYGRELDEECLALKAKFFELPGVLEAVDAFNCRVAEKIASKEPKRFKKDSTETVAYMKWVIKCAEAEHVNHFNIDSTQQLQWLFFERLGITPKRYTPKGAPAVDKKSLPYLGAPGRLLSKYRKLRDERKFVTATLNVQMDGVLHPMLKVPATITGRLGGGSND